MVADLGECTAPSPLRDTRFIDADERVLYRDDLDELRGYLLAGVEPPSFELAGPRARIFFHPGMLKCGIVTCGGLCPGLNDAVRSIVIGLREKYGVQDVYGFRFGYEGLVEKSGHKPVQLTTLRVGRIHELGGTVLGTSRGAQPAAEMVDTLQRLGIGLLFAIGGDGTLKGAHEIAEEVRRRGLAIGVIGCRRPSTTTSPSSRRPSASRPPLPPHGTPPAPPTSRPPGTATASAWSS